MQKKQCVGRLTLIRRTFNLCARRSYCGENKDAKLALDFAKKALEQNPYDATAYIVNGEAQILLNQNKEAIASFPQGD